MIKIVDSGIPLWMNTHGGSLYFLPFFSCFPSFFLCLFILSCWYEVRYHFLHDFELVRIACMMCSCFCFSFLFSLLSVVDELDFLDG